MINPLIQDWRNIFKAEIFESKKMDEKFSESKILDRHILTKEDLHSADQSDLYDSIVLADGSRRMVDAMGIIYLGRFWRLMPPVPRFEVSLAKRFVNVFAKVDRFSVSNMDVAAMIENIHDFEIVPGAVIVAAYQLKVRQIADDQGATLLGIERRTFTSLERFIRKEVLRVPLTP